MVRKAILLLLSAVLLVSSVACADMGEGDSETAFYEYFSSVYLLSQNGISKKSIEHFNQPVELGDGDVPQVIGYGKYMYIAFRVASGYALEVSEFAFFARTDGEAGTVDMEFFVSPGLPTKIKGDSGENGESEDIYYPEADNVTDEEGIYQPELDEDGNPVERENEADESMFAQQGYARSRFQISEEWSSMLLAFDVPQTVHAGEYIIIQVDNNCPFFSEELFDGTKSEEVNFTFNYLMFRFTKVTKS